MHVQAWFKALRNEYKTILTPFVLVLVLTGCGVFKNVGDLEVSELPEEVSDPCPHPTEFLLKGGTVAHDEITLGRVGDALIECGAEKAIAVQGYNDLRTILVQ